LRELESEKARAVKKTCRGHVFRQVTASDHSALLQRIVYFFFYAFYIVPKFDDIVGKAILP